ncbi:beta-galactosidase [Microbacterium halimionae]|uniref:Beta-galactosidase n=1 Tax=Microbacterium halimionae TaxID=1526413 RepID=A0A7W3JR35_9MICO|nr:beta-galactosidase [Microbacterium halimionae]MBA8817474.1 beta-galactosidase [Microbacterium halimionae]NII95083.1 beta-galactosidase [Microbacterium halimionae]
MAAPAHAFTHDGIAFGGDYNPEQWDPSVWEEDVTLMREAGVDLVAINIFGWAGVEPRDGEFTFASLDRIIELLHAADIRINLGTGTASPPAWLTRAHPEILPIAEDGTTRYPGGRQAWCPSSPAFRAAALSLVRAVAERYGSHPAVALWHVSNELGCHNSLCYCDQSAAAFRLWLRARYGSVDALNAAWGTAFWSQTYGDWEEILPPRAALSARNPGQALDFHRFSSDELLDHYRAEAAVIRDLSDVPVTTNFMVAAHIENMDYWQWAGEMDIVANDHYLDYRLGDPRTELSFAADLSRGLALGAPWLLMEHSAGAVNWQPINFPKSPGQMLRNSLTHVARGADAVCFFQWRASVQGSEKFHSAMLPHAGTGSTLWHDVVELGGIISKLDEVAGSRVVADIALVFSWESWWAADAESRPSSALGYLDQVHAVYAAFAALHVTIDVVAPGADLSAYRLVLVPGLHLVRDEEATVINDWISAGGTALVTFFSGIVDENDRVWTGGYTGPFRDALGIAVEEFAPVAPGARVSLGSGAAGTLWSERMHVTTAEVVDSFADGPAAGGPAITRNRWGSGNAWYLSTLLEPQAYRSLAQELVSAAGVESPVPVTGDSDGAVEIVRRRGDISSYVFAINHGSTSVQLQVSGTELITGDNTVATLEVPPGAVRIIREESAS